MMLRCPSGPLHCSKNMACLCGSHLSAAHLLSLRCNCLNDSNHEDFFLASGQDCTPPLAKTIYPIRVSSMLHHLIPLPLASPLCGPAIDLVLPPQAEARRQNARATHSYADAPPGHDERARLSNHMPISSGSMPSMGGTKRKILHFCELSSNHVRENTK